MQLLKISFIDGFKLISFPNDNTSLYVILSYT